MRITNQRQRQRDSVENSRLLMQVVVILRNLIILDRDLGLDTVVEICGFHVDLVFANGLDAGDVHPDLLHKGPSCEGDEGLENGALLLARSLRCVLLDGSWFTLRRGARPSWRAIVAVLGSRGIRDKEVVLIQMEAGRCCDLLDDCK